MNEQMEIKINGYQILEKTIKNSGNSGRVYVPIDWVGKRVKIILLDPIVSEQTTE